MVITWRFTFCEEQLIRSVGKIFGHIYIFCVCIIHDSARAVDIHHYRNRLYAKCLILCRELKVRHTAKPAFAESYTKNTRQKNAKSETQINKKKVNRSLYCDGYVMHVMFIWEGHHIRHRTIKQKNRTLCRVLHSANLDFAECIYHSTRQINFFCRPVDQSLPSV